MDSLPQANEVSAMLRNFLATTKRGLNLQYGLDSLWPDDDSALLWNLDFSQEVKASFVPYAQAGTLRATESASAAQFPQPDVKRKSNIMATDKTSVNPTVIHYIPC